MRSFLLHSIFFSILLSVSGCVARNTGTGSADPSIGDKTSPGRGDTPEQIAYRKSVREELDGREKEFFQSRGRDPSTPVIEALDCFVGKKVLLNGKCFMLDGYCGTAGNLKLIVRGAVMDRFGRACQRSAAEIDEMRDPATGATLSYDPSSGLFADAETAALGRRRVREAEALAEAEARARAEELARARARAEEIARARAEELARARARAEEIARARAEEVARARARADEIARARAEELARVEEIERGERERERLRRRREAWDEPDLDAIHSAMGEIVGAFLLDKFAKSEDKKSGLTAAVLAVGSRKVRAVATKKAIIKVFPNMDEDQIEIVNRVLSLYLDGQLGIEKFALATAKDEMIKELARHDPKLGRSAKIADFLYSVHKQMAKH
jgi:hypothetical protein